MPKSLQESFGTVNDDKEDKKKAARDGKKKDSIKTAS